MEIPYFPDNLFHAVIFQLYDYHAPFTQPYLVKQGINGFGVFRATDRPEPSRWPVFVRDENEHGGAFSRLLDSQEELDREIDSWPQAGSDPPQLRGTDWAERMRGIGGLSPRPVRPGDAASPLDSLRAAQREDMRIWEWTLSNPGE